MLMWVTLIHNENLIWIIFIHNGNLAWVILICNENLICVVLIHNANFAWLGQFYYVVEIYGELCGELVQNIGVKTI
jgi:hypothetical protein